MIGRRDDVNVSLPTVLLTSSMTSARVVWPTPRAIHAIGVASTLGAWAPPRARLPAAAWGRPGVFGLSTHRSACLDEFFNFIYSKIIFST
ncbi:hypothetical protein NL676_014329 [Syzygium grande]|nr:hypothetical protein NL676_014329 [Syzygium grande]